MSNFSYTVSQKDNKGLTEIFLQKAKAEGFKEKDIDWNAVMSVFDKIQTEEQAQGQSLFSGGTDKTRAGWHDSYVIKKGDKIELDENQVAEIYKAMGFTETPATPASTEKVPAQDAQTPTTTEPAQAPVVKETPAPADTTTTAPAAEVTTPTPVVKDSAATPTVPEPPKIVKAPDIIPPTFVTTDTTKVAPAEVKSAPVAVVTDTTKAETPQDSSKTKTNVNPQQGEYNSIKSDNISGDYKISAGENGKGFNLFSSVSVNGTPAEQKLFSHTTYDEETKLYSVRNLKSKDEQMLRDMADEESKDLAAKQAIYSDLNKRQSSGTTLSEPEKAFMTSHKKSLKEMGFQLNEKNEIIEIPKQTSAEQPQKTETAAKKPEEKGFFQKLFTWDW